jgi:hypothetical protein
MKVYVAKLFITDSNFTPPMDKDHELSIIVSPDGEFVKYIYAEELSEKFENRIPSVDRIKEQVETLEVNSPENVLLTAIDLYSRRPIFTSTEIIEGSTFKEVVEEQRKAVKLAYGRRTSNENILEEFGVL